MKASGAGWNDCKSSLVRYFRVRIVVDEIRLIRVFYLPFAFSAAWG